MVPKKPLGFNVTLILRYNRMGSTVYKHNIELHPANIFWHGKAVSIKYHKYMFLALRSHQAIRMRNIFICSLSGSKIFSYVIPIKRTILGGKTRLLNTKCVFWFPLQLLPETFLIVGRTGPPLCSSGQGFWLQIQRSRVRFPALPDFLSDSGSGTGYTQPREPREVNWVATWIK